MSSLSPFVSMETRCLAPSNVQILVDHLTHLPDDGFKDLAVRMQWDEVVTAPQCMEIDGKIQVINKQVLSPLQYAIWALPPDRLAWLLPHALSQTRPQSRFFRNDEGLIHENDVVFALLPAALSTGDKKKVDVVLDQVTPADDHRLMRMSEDNRVANTTETFTPDAHLDRIPTVLRHMASRVHKRVLEDSMFRNRPHDARRLADGIRKTFMASFAARGRLQALEAAYPAGRKVPMKVWDNALSHGGLVSWCSDKIDFIAIPGIADRRVSNDWSAEADSAPVLLVVNAAFQSEAASKAEFLLPEQRRKQQEWTTGAIEVLCRKWIEDGVTPPQRVRLWNVISRFDRITQDGLAHGLDKVQAARPEGFTEDWGSVAGEIQCWVKIGRFDLAAARAKAFPGVMPPERALALASDLCMKWCNAQQGSPPCDMSIPSSLQDQFMLHDAWGIAPSAEQLVQIAAAEARVLQKTLARFNGFMMDRRTELGATSPSPRRM